MVGKGRKTGVKVASGPKVALSVEHKRRMCEHKAANPKLTQKQLILWCESQFEISPNQATISTMLSQKHKWLDTSTTNAALQALTRDRSTTNTALRGLEESLFHWFKAADAKGMPLNDQVMILKAKEIGEEVQDLPEGFNYSGRWLLRWKKQKGISMVELHGEAESADFSHVATMRTDLPLLLQSVSDEYGISIESTYNMDETGYFWRQLPVRSLTARDRKGLKLAKNRITVALTANAAGTDKLDLFIIGNAKKPRSFKSFVPEKVGVQYFHNKTAWLNAGWPS